MNTTACLVAWRQFEGKSWFKRKKKKTVGHRFVQGSANVHTCPLPRPLEPSSTDHPSLISVSSCGELGDLTLKTPGRISGTGTAGGLCVSCSGGWAHPNAQTSSHSPPSRSGKASPLWWKHNTHRAVSTGPEVKNGPAFPTFRRKRGPSCPAASV